MQASLCLHPLVYMNEHCKDGEFIRNGQRKKGKNEPRGKRHGVRGVQKQRLFDLPCLQLKGSSVQFCCNAAYGIAQFFILTKLHNLFCMYNDTKK